MENCNLGRELTCVLFPGMVKNEEKALQCLGGVRQISQIHSQAPKKRLGLSFHPDNPFMKKIFADRKDTGGVLLRVKVKKTKLNNEVKKEVVSTSVVGRVRMIYKFESLCDFQYLPVNSESNGPLKCILEDLMPSGVDDLSFMLGPAPNFILPSNFSRLDKPIKYSYTEKKYLTCPKQKIVSDDEDIHQRRRGDRMKPLAQVEFNLVKAFPTEPHEDYLNAKLANKHVEKDFEVVRKLFEERPIWSQNLLRHITKIRLNNLKIIMPCLAIFVKNGPWRMLWIRYGYDPRKEPGARFYQTLDFRMRRQDAIYSRVMSHERERRRASSSQVKIEGQQKKPDTAMLPNDDVSENTVIFRPGMLPAQRQIFYQYCDIKIPEVEALLAQEPPPGYLCHQKRGWLPPNTDTVCRDHMFQHMKQTLLSVPNASFKLEQASSDEDSVSEEEDEIGTSSMDEASSSNIDVKTNLQ